MFYVYILQSEVDESFYIGFTESLEKRVNQHNNGESNYTSRKMPWKLVYFEELITKKEAIKREKFLKAQKNKVFYQSLIDSLDR
jgi:putative endonuclease